MHGFGVVFRVIFPSDLDLLRSLISCPLPVTALLPLPFAFVASSFLLDNTYHSKP